MTKYNDEKIAILLKRDFQGVSVSRKSLTEIVSALGGGVRTDFSEAAAHRLLLKRQPALRFETEKGLTGIAARYVMPENIRPYDLEQVVLRLPLTSDALPLYKDIWRRLKELNPGLKRVSVQADDPRGLHYALTGVVSGFNADDIDYFLRYARNEPSYAEGLPQYRKLFKNIERRIGAPYWVPAPLTLRKIKAQLDKKDTGPGIP